MTFQKMLKKTFRKKLILVYISKPRIYIVLIHYNLFIAFIAHFYVDKRVTDKFSVRFRLFTGNQLIVLCVNSSIRFRAS